MGLFDYLENILGRTSRTYEELMQSRDQDHDFGEHDVKQLADQLEDLVQDAEAVVIPTDFQAITVDSNALGKATHYVASLTTKGNQLHLFTTRDKSLKSEGFNQLVSLSHDQLSALDVKVKHPTSEKIKSLPDWEGIRRIGPSIYRECTERSSSPWTLYKLARAVVIGEQDHKNQIGGYPRWVANFPRKELGDTSPPLLLEWSISTYDHVGKVYWFEKDGSPFQLIQKD